ncbi:MAG: molybdate ABC transporter substrate-binding protein [Candidatus Nanopelagicales bacterium]
MRRHPPSRVLAVCLLAGGCLLGCGSAPEASSASGHATDTITGEILVFAAASLTEPFTTIGAQLESDHPGTTVTFSFAGSSALATQITTGAPADVFAPASASAMDQVIEAGTAATAVTFATNTLAIAVPPSNPGGVASLADLADPAVKVALCQEQVPCGTVAQKVLANADVAIAPVTLEPDVKAVLTKVRIGEVDAGLVYVSDVVAAGDDVARISIPADVNASTSYPIAVLTEGPTRAAAQAFVDEVRSERGQAVLQSAGFAPATRAPATR